MPATWLEPDQEFEGVGAHRLNPRYDPVDEDDEEEPVGTRVRSLLEIPRLKALRAAVGSYRLDGHDGSHHQFDAGPVDIPTLAAATWIIWWKATQSTQYADPTFRRMWDERRRFDYALAYHWLSSTTDPQQQAAHFLQVLNGLVAGDGVMLDAEEAGITADKCVAWCEAIEAVTKRPVSVYSGLYVSSGSIWKSDALRESKYGMRAFHVAAYVTEDNLKQRIISTGSQNYPFHAWQWSSNGPVPGITGRADMNRVEARSLYDLVCGVTTTQPPVPQPLGEDMPDVYYTNAEAREWNGNTYPAKNIKYILMLDGTARRISGEELTDRGVAVIGLEFGIPKTNDYLNQIGEYKAPTGGSPSSFTVVSTVKPA